MLKLLGLVFAVLAGIVAAAALAYVLTGRERSLEIIFGPIDSAPVDFATVDTTGRENTYLVCPPDFCGQDPGRPSPVFAFSAIELRNRWFAMIGTQPRTDWIASDEAILQYDFVQRSKLMRFPDTITVRFLPLGEDQSTLAVFSRSHYGRKDFGVNQARIEAWLANLAGTDR